MKCLQFLWDRGRAITGGCLLTTVALLSCSAQADCQFQSVGDVSFGAYDVFSKLPNLAGVGHLRIKCQGVGHVATVSLSTGQSHSYVARVMRSGNDVLTYNLYTSPARVVVWGDGTRGSSVMTASKNQSTTLDIFGSIPEGQDPSAGSYADTILMSIDF